MWELLVRSFLIRSFKQCCFPLFSGLGSKPIGLQLPGSRRYQCLDGEGIAGGAGGLGGGLVKAYTIISTVSTVGFFFLSPVSLSVFSLVPDLFFDFSRVLEYAKILTVLHSINQPINQLNLKTVNGFASWFSDMPCNNYKL